MRGSGEEGGEGEAESGLKQPFELKQQCCAFSMHGTRTGTIHRVGQDCC